MRIVSGEFKGRRFSPPKSFKARPTTDVAKESLFNVLNNRIDFEETKMLDLFSGSGSISFEFASRGATDITLVELDFNHFSFIKSVIDELKLTQAINPIKGDAFRFLKQCEQKYDVIFADPPYELKNIEQIPQLVIERELLKPDGFLVFEHSDKLDFSHLKGFYEKREYGKVNFSFFKGDI